MNACQLPLDDTLSPCGNRSSREQFVSTHRIWQSVGDAACLESMEQQIIHACGHEQAHVIYGFDSQIARKARWLRSTKCRACFVADKKAEQVDAAARDSAIIAHLDLTPLTGSERQVAWAENIRISRLASLAATSHTTTEADCNLCLRIYDAKWWIDHRDLPNEEFLVQATSYLQIAGIPADGQRSAAA